ncbi:hypothetical protein AVEN_144531-1 [Araneus ventricosus]|uniref:Uncharacterized protein n=1 Tax=Araneus ventricosus TaxID=182803 RepID=A0A4Y2ISH7_ARAVE|nr:hypothetical protein AVEN_144531-1 [Araneus ventricosus]
MLCLKWRCSTVLVIRLHEITWLKGVFLFSLWLESLVLRGSLIRVSTVSGDPYVTELPSARGYILASEPSQSSTVGAPVFDHRSCPFSPSMSDSPLDD